MHHRSRAALLFLVLGTLMASAAYGEVLKLYYKDKQTGMWGAIRLDTETCEILSDKCCYPSPDKVPIAAPGSGPRGVVGATDIPPSAYKSDATSVVSSAPITDVTAAHLAASLKSVKARLQSKSYSEIGQIRRMIDALDESSLLLLTKGDFSEEALLKQRLEQVENRLSAVGQVMLNGSWTDWFNNDNQGGAGDYELLKSLVESKKTCAGPLAIECKTVKGETDWSKTQLVYHCDLATGGYCVNREQAPGKVCEDFKVRYLCPAGS